MTVHQCPKCELRFAWKTELEDHCWHDHPEFRHEYPVRAIVVADPVAPVAPPPTPRERRHHDASELFAWVLPSSGRRGDQRKPG
jgi:hypothetical protein